MGFGEIRSIIHSGKDFHTINLTQLDTDELQKARAYIDGYLTKDQIIQSIVFSEDLLDLQPEHIPRCSLFGFDVEVRKFVKDRRWKSSYQYDPTYKPVSIFEGAIIKYCFEKARGTQEFEQRLDLVNTFESTVLKYIDLDPFLVLDLSEDWRTSLGRWSFYPNIRLLFQTLANQTRPNRYSLTLQEIKDKHSSIYDHISFDDFEDWVRENYFDLDENNQPYIKCTA